MTRVQFAPISLAVAGAAVVTVLVAVAVVRQESWQPALLGLFAALGYLLISTVLLLRGLRRASMVRFGPANVVTTVRSTLVGVITGMVAASFVAPIPVGTLVAVAVPALLLDAVDGWIARRTNSASELGARFDMEVDAFLLLVLSAYVSQRLGVWVLAIGAMRYAFVAAGWIMPWLREQLPFRYWRKVVTAAQGAALTIAAAEVLPGFDVVLVAIALAMLVESFGRDVLWLGVRRHSQRAPSTPQDDQRDAKQHDADRVHHDRLRYERERPGLGDTE
jgi:phosphatidylglycerophosphate synthase